MKNAQNISLNNFRKILSAIIVVGYLMLIGAIVVIEASDSINMLAGENSFLDILKILVGVMTAVVMQVVNYWFETKPSAQDTFEGGQAYVA